MKNWYIEVTKENLEELSNWRKKKCGNNTFFHHSLCIGYFVLSKHYRDESFYWCGTEEGLLKMHHSGYEKINLQQFRQITNMKKELTSEDFKVGQIVQVNVENDEPRYGWGKVHNKQKGIVTRVDNSDSTLYVRFSTQDSWRTQPNELLILEEDPTHAICKKEFPGGKVGDRFEFNSRDRGFFTPDFFDFEFEDCSLPSVKICGYDVHFNKKEINWGCRKFTIEEIIAVKEAVSILEDRSLGFKLQFEGEISDVRVSDLMAVIKYYDHINN